MKSPIRSLTKILWVVTILMMTGIIWMHGNQLKGLKKQNLEYLPVDAFAQIETNVLLSSENSSDVIGAVGSGIVFYIDNDHSYILTANHVCIPPFYSRVLEVYGNQNVIVVNSIIDYSGQTRFADVVYNDEAKDLCILRAEGVWTEPVSLSSTPPRIGQTAYSLSAPGGFFSPGMVPIFDGIYSGMINHPLDRDDIYTMPTQPGSSGAAVLNGDFEIIGVIHSAVYENSSIGIASTHEEVTDFLYGWEVLFGFRVHQDSM